MWFYIKLAWRNIFRNQRRTVIAATAIGVGLAALIFTDALMRGVKSSTIRSATASFIGEAQIHHRDFRKTREVEKTVNEADAVISDLESEEVVDRFARRTISFAMLTSPAGVNAILLVGVEPDSEPYLSQVDDAIRQGTFFAGGNDRDILVGSKLAEVLDVSIGDRVVVTVSRALSHELVQEMFRISGIFHFNVKGMDRGMAFIRLPRAQQMLGLGTGIHEIAIKFKDLKFASEEGHPFWEKYSSHGNEALSWMTLLPQLRAVFKMSQFSFYFGGVVLFALVAFGIINTLFMSLYERMFEFGVIRAIGTRPGGIRKLIVLEAGCLGLLSILIGIILGFVLTFLLTKVGLDSRGIEYAGTTIREMFYPELQFRQYIIYPLWVLGLTMLVGLYPAVVAGRMNISAALRKSL